MRRILALSWALLIALGLTIGAWRLDLMRAKQARTQFAQRILEQALVQWDLLQAPGTLNGTDRVARATQVLNTGLESKPLQVRLRPPLGGDLDAEGFHEVGDTFIQSRKLSGSEGRVLEISLKAQALHPLGATTPQDGHIRLILSYLLCLFFLLPLGRKLFG